MIAENAEQKAELQKLRDEINRLKGEQGKPDIKANKKKDGDISSEAERGREFDPVKVGFASKDRSSYPSLFEFDTALPSNGNTGHQYAAGVTPIIKLDGNGKPIRNREGQFETEKLPPISDQQRQALVEYLKTL